MITHLAQSEHLWLSRFFSAPNELLWDALVDGTAPAPASEQINRWLSFLYTERSDTPLILPFMRGGKITGWYATGSGLGDGNEVFDDLNAWLGPSYLSRIDRIVDGRADPMAKALLDRFGSPVFRFTGPDERSIRLISVRLEEFATVLGRRPAKTTSVLRPVGAIRSDFERALIVQDEALAEAMIGELKQTGRLNEENLKYLEVRLSAGLGLWPQIARNHWLIKTMADLALPPQILADIIEALYRTYIESKEEANDRASMLEAFARDIAGPYPKLFSTRRGIRSPRVAKAFLLFDQLLPTANAKITADLLHLLPEGTNASLFMPSLSNYTTPAPTPEQISDEADDAFDDGQIDRALECYLQLPPTKKTISRLVSCAGTISTLDAFDRVLAVVDRADRALIANLPTSIANKVAQFRERLNSPSPSEDVNRPAPPEADVNPWMRWAEQLKAGQDLSKAELDIQAAPTNWDISEFRQSAGLSQAFADIIGNLSIPSAKVLRANIAALFSSFFPVDAEPCSAIKPIASVLFLLVAMDDALSRADLDLLAQLATQLVSQGLSAREYDALLDDLADVQKRIGSYSYLPWSLDICEALAIMPCPSEANRDSRLRLFLLVISQAAAFRHRLGPQDLLPIETLAMDYGVEAEALQNLKVGVDEAEQVAALPNMKGKTIGIYTLAESAGTRAKAALEKMFSGCKVVVNSDLVCTSQLSNLAKIADLFVFAWKSSSHQAFYCVKDALEKGEPIWAPGKGTASILRAVLDKCL